MQQFHFQGFVAIESISQPGYYIVQQGRRLKIRYESQQELYKTDASFKLVKHTTGNYFIMKSFRTLFNVENNYL